jgi:methyl-accepting chemotaxis protein
MSFANFKVGTRHAIGFGTLIAIMIVVAAVGTITAHKQVSFMTKAVDVDVAYASEVLRLRAQIANLRRYEKDLILTSADAATAKGYMDQWRATQKRAQEHAAAATTLIEDDIERARLTQLVEALGKYEAEMEKIYAAIVSGEIRTPEAGYLKVAAFRHLVRDTEAVTGELYEASTKQLAAVRPQIEVNERRRQVNVAIGVPVVILLAILLGMLISRSITRPVAEAVRVAEALARGDLGQKVEAKSRDEMGRLMLALAGTVGQLSSMVNRIKQTTDTVNTASREIAQGNADLSTRTEQQASALEETSASMQQMTATVGQNAQNAKKANELAAQASGVAAKGGEVVREAVDTMNGITESSKKIADIIGVIDGIAFQTNILALNAAVEAARAGEQGRGFAVVASEVRNLAQRSAAAAKEIKGLITDSVAKVDAGSRQVNDAGRTMEEIVGSVKKVSTLIAEITAASQEQAQGIEQVSETMTQLEKVTQQNAAMVEEASAAAGSLEEQSRELSNAVAVFRLDHEVQRT